MVSDGLGLRALHRWATYHCCCGCVVCTTVCMHCWAQQGLAHIRGSCVLNTAMWHQPACVLVLCCRVIEDDVQDIVAWRNWAQGEAGRAAAAAIEAALPDAVTQFQEARAALVAAASRLKGLLTDQETLEVNSREAEVRSRGGRWEGEEEDREATRAAGGRGTVAARVCSCACVCVCVGACSCCACAW
jgi:hypothetical protein